MELNKIYFYTATIEGWKHLLKQDKFKDIIIDSLKYLSEKELINVYAFVIMPSKRWIKQQFDL
jgi:putative transposase